MAMTPVCMRAVSNKTRIETGRGGGGSGGLGRMRAVSNKTRIETMFQPHFYHNQSV